MQKRDSKKLQIIECNYSCNYSCNYEDNYYGDQVCVLKKS